MRDVIIACDFKDKETTLNFLKKFEGLNPYVKIGMELFYGEGPDIVREIKAMGYKIFLDLKLHDIPNTVRKAMANLARLGVDMTNVHASGTVAMMEAAKQGLIEGANGGEVPILIAVTQLTSTSEETMQRDLLIPEKIENVVAHYAQNAQKAGLDGVVCSPLEAEIVKKACGTDFKTVTPGIRYPDGDKGDQARVTTPMKAREIGTDFIVVGRPITAQEDPVAAYLRVRKDFLGE
ncbi:MAG: orotidine-5'-phosphate decarboxylase [Clostridia bacterium]|nr:orotidine-5'-phosphate decarboxylase [Clostridia bacterium]